jgi:hypothetical protein
MPGVRQLSCVRIPHRAHKNRRRNALGRRKRYVEEIPIEFNIVVQPHDIAIIVVCVKYMILCHRHAARPEGRAITGDAGER